MALSQTPLWANQHRYHSLTFLQKEVTIALLVWHNVLWHVGRCQPVYEKDDRP